MRACRRRGCQENVVEATCTVGGSYDSVVYCSLCGEKMSSTAVVVDALGHSWGEPVRTEATTEANAFDTYTCTVCGETKVEEVPDTQLPENVITKQPVNDVKAKGKVATFTVETTGNVTYQWQRIKSGATAWTDITGATSATYSVTVSSTTIIPYRCVVTDAAGNKYISDEVTIVEPEPLVTVLNEGGNLHVIKNTVVSFHVELDNVEGVTFQWQREKIAGRWFNVKNIGYDTDTVSFSASPYGNYPYRCEITDANGTKIYSGIYTLTFYEPPVNPRIVKNP